MADQTTNEYAIQVNDLAKAYDLNKKNIRSSKEAVQLFFSNFFGKKRDGHAIFWALRGISFTVKAGEILGIIGDNGAGKSTLLKIIGGISPPTQGSVELWGSVASILEIGTGFHPELTGKENIYLSASILGMDRQTIDKHFDQIVQFSEIGSFIDVPVKKYSSGMFMRLAFSIIAHVEADIILMDEVFSVGDNKFRIKSQEKIKALARSGKSIIYVSHDLNTVRDFCKTCIILDKGKIVDQGPVSQLVTKYLTHTLDQVLTEQIEEQPLEETQLEDVPSLINEQNEPKANASNVQFISYRKWPHPETAPGNDAILLKYIGVKPAGKTWEDSIYHRDEVEIEFAYEKRDDTLLLPSVMLRYQLSSPLLVSNPFFNLSDSEAEADRNPGTYHIRCKLPGYLLNAGIYTIELFFSTPEMELFLHLPNLLNYQISLEEDYPMKYKYDGNFSGPLLAKIHWSRETPPG